jgi:uncharacterized protein (DUF952 family)
MSKIYHIVLPKDWESQKTLEAYVAESLHTEGFIHCSLENQLSGVLSRYYQGIESVVLLEIETDLLTSPLKMEWADSVNEEFPHIFGAINKSAIVNITKLSLPLA